MSHAEVARRTEVALRRNEERKAEKEERKLRMAQARLAKENTPKTPNTPAPKRVKQSKKKETKQTPNKTPSQTPSRSRGSKRARDTLGSAQKTKDQSETTPKNQSRSARAKRVRSNLVSPIESNRKEGSSVGSSGVEKALDYSAQVFAAVEEEIKAQIKTSPQRFQKMKSVLTPKLNQNPKNSYENQLFDNLTIESREDPNLWNSLGKDNKYC